MEPDYTIELSSENGRVSQQTFPIILQSVAASPSNEVAVVSDEIIHSLPGFNRRIALHDFNSYEKILKIEFLSPFFHPAVTTFPVAFEIVISGAGHEPYLLQASKLYQSTYIIITS